MAPGSSHELYGALHEANCEQLVQRKPQMPVFIAPDIWKQPHALFGEHRSYCVVLRQIEYVASAKQTERKQKQVLTDVYAKTMRIPVTLKSGKAE